MSSGFAHRLRVRYAECDRQGVVFNAHYLAYFDTTLTEMWREAFGSYDAMVGRGVDIVVAEARLRFLSPARFDDELEIVATITTMGNSNLSSHFEVRRDGETLVEGDMRHVFVDARALTKTPMPDWARAGLTTWLVEPGAGSGEPLIERQ